MTEDIDLTELHTTVAKYKKNYYKEMKLFNKIAYSRNQFLRCFFFIMFFLSEGTFLTHARRL